MRPISLLLILIGCLWSGGCQQTRLSFTQVEAPKVPSFTAPTNAPTLAKKEFTPLAPPEVISLSDELSLHLLPGTPSRLVGIHLLAVSPDAPYENLDIMHTALQQLSVKLANQHDLPCIEGLTIHPSIHGLRLSLKCPASELAQAVDVLAQSWSSDAYGKLDLPRLKRQLALDKHIRAFNGSEIEEVWADKILGSAHPYNKALNNRELQQSLDKPQLLALLKQTKAQSQWHLLLEGVPQVDDSLREQLTASLSQLGAQQRQEERFVDTFSPYGKQLFVIDAPGTVQTQVRIGYHLPMGLDDQEDSAFACEALSRWLGRSFSGRLYFDLREQRGLTYGIYGRCFNNPMARILKYYGATQQQHTGAFIRGILDHLKLAAEAPPTEAELAALKTSQFSQIALRQDDPGHRIEDYSQAIARQAGSDAMAARLKRWQTLTPEVLQALAQAHFGQEPVIVIRGDLARIRPDLEEKLPEWQLKVTSVD
ncbi:insulinase family protein [Shewanella rhizosphaerae]|uniref:M16 family metallopeptidase n=1 Tax=Shewanella rhizosphaerae TaxID=2864207 RepID=UPI001C661F9E|nr:insulinase family protein [Shewanella rhizosphaerae]QYK13570.1 insulinase family protein [Shewanella rhizosphaerae]